MEDIEYLKESLSSELSKSNSQLDYDRVLNLANRLAKFDLENVRFTVDASHISRLGQELVSKQETAVAELIKNAYDADAATVRIYFKNTTTPGGELVIEDDGGGMNRLQLIDGFMRISTQEKSNNPRSDIYHRQRAGRKGIGRFSAQRLGRQLEIITARPDSMSALFVEINWDKFDEDGDLILVSNQISEIPKDHVGTILRVKNLKDSWSVSQIQRAYRYIAELLQPFPLRTTVGKSDQDPGFNVEIYTIQDGVTDLVANEEKNILAHAQAEISGFVDNDGTPYVSVKSLKSKIDIADEVLNVDERIRTDVGEEFKDYGLLSGIEFKAYYFIDENLPAGSRRIVRNVLKTNGGIRVYRNGFRVLPYGEMKDDWLGLQRSSALRQILPPHHNSNFIGFVQINDVDGVNFEETASREGLIENSAFRQLQDYLYKAITYAVTKIAHARGKKIFASDDVEDRLSSPSVTSAKNLVREIKVLAESIGTSDIQKEFTPQIGIPLLQETKNSDAKLTAAAIVEKVDALDIQSQIILEELGMLRVLASLGLTIGEFTHETRHVLIALGAGISSLSESEVGSRAVNDLKLNIEALQVYMRYFDKAVTQNSQRTLQVHEVRDIVHDFSHVVSFALQRQNVSLDVQIKGYDLFVRPSHKSEWSSILFNLMTNSLKAINKARVTGKILIKAGEIDSDSLFIDFIDNGIGVPVELRERIFDAFYTTTTPADALAEDETLVTGSGLGLKIVRDIIEDAGGSIYVADAPEGYSTCFRIDFPRANDEEIPDELR